MVSMLGWKLACLYRGGVSSCPLLQLLTGTWKDMAGSSPPCTEGKMGWRKETSFHQLHVTVPLPSMGRRELKPQMLIGFSHGVFAALGIWKQPPETRGSPLVSRTGSKSLILQMPCARILLGFWDWLFHPASLKTNARLGRKALPCGVKSIHQAVLLVSRRLGENVPSFFA